MEAAPVDDAPIDFGAMIKGGAPTADAPSGEDAPIDFGALISDRPKLAPGQKSGITANVAAGAVEGGSGVLNVLSDPVGNLIGKPIGAAAVAAYHFLAPHLGLPEMSEGTRNDLLGTTDPDQIGTILADKAGRALGAPATSDVIPANGVDRYARAGTSGAIGMLGFGPTSLGNAAKLGALGTSSGLASQGADDAVSDPNYKPLASVAAGFAVPMAGELAATRFGRPSLQTQAADTLLSTASDPVAVKSAIAAGPEATVESSPQTLGMATNDSGIKGLENVVRTQNDAAFREIDNARNSAQTRAMESVIPPDASPEDAARHIVGRLTGLQDERADLVGKAGAAADAVEARVPASVPLDETGAAMKQAVGDASAPLREGLASQDAAAGERLQTAFTAADHGLSDTPGASVSQQIGAAHRGLLGDAEAASKAPVDAMYKALREAAPDLSIDPAGIKTAMGGITSELRPGGGQKLTPIESSMADVVKRWDNSPVVPMEDALAFHQELGAAIGQSRLAQEGAAVRRLTILRNAVDASLNEGLTAKIEAERAAVKNGTMSAGDTVESKLGAQSDFSASQPSGQRQMGAVAGGGAGADEASFPGIRAPDGSGAGYSALPAVEGRSNGLVSPSVAGVAREQAPLTRSDYEPAPSNVNDLRKEATAAYREHKQTFGEGAVGKVLDETRYGDPKAALSSVPAAFTKTREGAQQYFKATGDTPAAQKAWADSLALDAFGKPGMIGPDGKINTAKLTNWLTNNAEVLSVAPDIRARFADVASASREVEAVQAKRAAVDAEFQSKIKGTDAKFAADSFPTGAKGAESVRRYLADTKATPAALDSLMDQVATTYRNSVMPDGEYKAGMPAYWRKQFGSALDALKAAAPERAAVFDDAVTARSFLDKQTAGYDAAIKEYQESAAKVWLDGKTGNAASADKAMGSVMATKNPAETVRQLIKPMQDVGDEAAVNGVRRALYDRVFKGTVSNAEKGEDLGLRPDRFQTALDKNQDVLAAAFDEKSIKTLGAMARDLQIGQRVTTGASPINSATAMRTYGIKKSEEVKPSMLVTALARAVPLGGAGIGYMLDGVRGAAEGAVVAGKMKEFITEFAKSRGVARNAAVRELIFDAIKDPFGAGRILMQHATPENTPSLLDSLSRAYVRSTMATVNRDRRTQK